MTSGLIHLKGLLDGVRFDVERSPFEGAPAYTESNWAVDHPGDCNCLCWWNTKGLASFVEGEWRIHMSNGAVAVCCGWRRISKIAPSQLGDMTLAQWREDTIAALFALQAARYHCPEAEVARAPGLE